MGQSRIAMLLMVAVSQAWAQPAPPPQAAPQSAAGSTKRIFLPAPLVWDSAMLSYRPALQQTATDFANLTGGLVFGMSPAALNAKLPEPYPGLTWNGLALANEYPGEARYFGVPMSAAGSLRMGLAGCTGNASYVVFAFNGKGLFRISYRLAADMTCPDPDEAAQQIYARYVPLRGGVAYSVRYRTGKTQVVDITDPTASAAIPIRWRQGTN